MISPSPQIVGKKRLGLIKYETLVDSASCGRRHPLMYKSRLEIFPNPLNCLLLDCNGRDRLYDSRWLAPWMMGIPCANDGWLAGTETAGQRRNQTTTDI